MGLIVVGSFVHIITYNGTFNDSLVKTCMHPKVPFSVFLLW